VPAENLHPVATEASDPRASAAAYERELRSFFPGAPAFDVLLLGVGEDGHVASLFPGSREAEERDRWVVGVEDSPKPPPRRVSLTLPAINAASRVHFLAAGGAKAEAVAGALEGRPDLPAGRVRPAAGTVSWWLDRAAARHIK
jgi:6-phosphogluconolactonase